MTRRLAPAAEPVELHVESVEAEGRGIARHDGKVGFVRGGLPGEHVVAHRVRSKPRFDVYEVDRVVRASSQRVEPACPHFGVCGGCSMQHANVPAQLAYKQRALEDTLRHIGGLPVPTLLPPIEGPSWGYRHRARLTVRRVVKKGGVLVGFHEKGSSYVADMTVCRVLPPRLSAMLVPMRALVETLSIRERLPQIEVAIGDAPAGSDLPDGLHVALVFRVLEPPTDDDLARLRAFARHWRIAAWLQPKGPDSIVEIEPLADGPLSYGLPDYGLRIPFAPTEFTQVNAAINRVLVARAVDLLDPGPDDAVLDLFCGLGNFTLPLATRARSVHGIEGSKALVARALHNAEANRARLLGEPGAANGVRFSVADLFQFDRAAWDALGRVDRVLIDPPRDGAVAVARVLAQLGAGAGAVGTGPDGTGANGTGAAPAGPPRDSFVPGRAPKRIVYVSCNPATLARDAAILVHEGGWTMTRAGVINMFPQTSHVESIAVFEPGPSPAAPSARPSPFQE